MEYIDLRKVGRDGLKEIRRQVVRLKKMGKTGKEIEELTGVRQNRVSEIWTAYQREGESSLERKIWAKAWDTHGSDTGRAGGYSDGDQREKAGGFRNHREMVDVRPNEAVHPKAMGESSKQADAV